MTGVQTCALPIFSGLRLVLCWENIWAWEYLVYGQRWLSTGRSVDSVSGFDILKVIGGGKHWYKIQNFKGHWK